MFADFDSKLEINHQSRIYFDIPFHRTRHILFINAVIEKVIAELDAMLIGVYGSFKVPFGDKLYDVSMVRHHNDIVEIYVSCDGSFYDIKKRIGKQRRKIKAVHRRHKHHKK